MSAYPEEDVLAALLLEWLRETVDPDLYYDGSSWLNRMIALGRTGDDPTRRRLEEAIADSERRYEMERAWWAVIDAALEWRDAPTALASEGLDTAIDALLHAEAEAR